MPNRIIKESICRSEEIDSLSWFEEVLFYRLIVTCDDFGRYDGRAKIIKGSCFPLKDITEKDIDKALGRLSAVGLVRVYEAQGRPDSISLSTRNCRFLRRSSWAFCSRSASCSTCSVSLSPSVWKNKSSSC